MNEKEIIEQLKEINKKLDKQKHDDDNIWLMLIFAALFVAYLVDKVLSVIYS